MRMSLRAALMAAALATAHPALAEPITLGSALERALANSPRIAAAQARVAAAEGRARQAGVAPNPEVSLEVEDFAGNGPFRSFDSAQTTLALSQRLEVGGQRSARRAVAAGERDVAALSLLRERVDLRREVEVAFAELSAATDRATLARDNAVQAASLANTARILVEAGRDPPLRQLRAEAALADARAAELEAFSAMLAARRILATLIASDDAELTPSQGTETGAAAEPMGRNEPGFASIDERLADAEQRVAAARIALAQSAATPDVTVSGGLRRFSDGRDTAFVVGVSIPIPIRDRNRGGIEAARADATAAEFELERVRADARRDRAQARMLVEAADARLEALEGPGLAQAEEALRLAQIGYSAGRFSLLELLDAQTALTSARRAIIDARLDRARALAALNRAFAREEI
ncbi:TolC family protein [Erythrobacter colymbi]|jgi:outer membrane protein, heavy metal efflux system|uniref:TolC family protein n=2 Tax=Erythrobacter/Porphyrobacter group TaxID=2800788 RepID=UPI000A394D10